LPKTSTNRGSSLTPAQRRTSLTLNSTSILWLRNKLPVKNGATLLLGKRAPPCPRVTFRPPSLSPHIPTAHIDYAMAVSCHRVKARKMIKRIHRSTPPHTPETLQETINACMSLSLDGSWHVVRRTRKDTRPMSKSLLMGRNLVPLVRLSCSRNPFLTVSMWHR